MSSQYDATRLTPIQKVPPPPLWSRDFILITLINLLMFLGFQMYPSALPPYVKALGAPDDILGWLTGISTLAMLLTRPIAGLILDKLGRRGVFLGGLVFMIAASASLFFFPVVGIIILIRFIHGLGWGVANTASSTIAADTVPKQRFGEGMGYFSLSASLAMAISPAIALSLKPAPMFIIATVFMAAALVLGLFLRFKPVPTEPDASSKKRRNPYEKAAIMPAAIMFLTCTAYGATVTFMAVYAESRGIDNIGPFFTVFALVMLLTRPTIGKMVDTRGQNSVILPGIVALFAALILLSQATGMLVFLLSAALYGIGQGSLFTATQTVAVLNSPKDRVGAANATLFTGLDGGIGFGAVLAGFLAKTVGYADMFLLLALCPVLAALLFYAYLKRSKK